MDLIHEIRTIYDNYDFKTEILAASIRTANHVKDVAMLGADVATVPPAVLRSLINHPLTDKGLEQRSEEPTSELQSLMRTSYAVFFLKQKTRLRVHTSAS